MSNKNILAELKSAIGQKIAPPAAAAPVAPAREATPAGTRKASARRERRKVTKPAVPEPPARSGRGVQFYLDDGDRKIIHRLAVWFGSQDRRVSDSQVIKAAIRVAETHQGAKLLEVCDEVRATDRRLQKKTHPRAGKESV